MNHLFKKAIGWVASKETGERKDITVNFLSKDNGKDLLIGGSLIFAGTMYIARQMFMKGALAFDAAEFDALETLGILKDN